MTAERSYLSSVIFAVEEGVEVFLELEHAEAQGLGEARPGHPLGTEPHQGRVSVQSQCVSQLC